MEGGSSKKEEKKIKNASRQAAAHCPESTIQGSQNGPEVQKLPKKRKKVRSHRRGVLQHDVVGRAKGKNRGRAKKSERHRLGRSAAEKEDD